MKGWNTQLMMLLPITGTLLVKKGTGKQSKENAVDFHLEIIKKIDKLLTEHEQDTLAAETVQTPPINPLQPPIPIEPRMPLNRTLSHQEIAWQSGLDQPRTTTQTIPDEFKTELNNTPEFRFITSREFTETVSEFRPKSEDRIEIIDLGVLVDGDVTFRKMSSLDDIQNHDDAMSSSMSNNKVEEKHHNKKTEVIDARTLKQKIYEELCAAASHQSEEIEKKAQIYFVNSKDHIDKKQKKLEIEQTYIPVDFEKRSKELKHKQSREEDREDEEIDEEDEQRRQQEEKNQRHLERKEEKLENFESEETELVQKKYKHVPTDKKITKDTVEVVKTPRQLKKEAKEQRRLQRLQMRQARSEEKRHNKEQKKALKLKQRQQFLLQKEQQKQQKHKSNKKTQSSQPIEIDEDLRKVLRMTDSLLEHLPDNIIDQFVQSENFDIYQRVLNKYKVYERVMSKHRIK